MVVGFNEFEPLLPGSCTCPAEARWILFLKSWNVTFQTSASSTHHRVAPRLLCAAAPQKNNGQSPEEDSGAPKVEVSTVEKALVEEKAHLEEQLKDITVRAPSVAVAPGVNPCVLTGD